MRLDGDAALALEIHGVEDLGFHLARLERAGELEEAIGQRRLAVVDVGDDREVADETLIHQDSGTGNYTAPSMPARPSAGAEARRVSLASAVGTTIEWYDFFIYGTAAATVFGPQFFPQVSELAGTLASFATFGIGFIARPLGGVVMGHYGDRLGRKFMLVWSLLLMGSATLAIGLLPTYAQIGVWAPVLLVVLRFVQGFALGGEWGGAVLMSVEHAPEGRRGFFGSVVALGLPAGIVLSNLVFLIASTSVAADGVRRLGLARAVRRQRRAGGRRLVGAAGDLREPGVRRDAAGARRAAPADCGRAARRRDARCCWPPAAI